MSDDEVKLESPAEFVGADPAGAEESEPGDGAADPLAPASATLVVGDDAEELPVPVC